MEQRMEQKSLGAKKGNNLKFDNTFDSAGLSQEISNSF